MSRKPPIGKRSLSKAPLTVSSISQEVDCTKARFMKAQSQNVKRARCSRSHPVRLSDYRGRWALIGKLFLSKNLEVSELVRSIFIETQNWYFLRNFFFGLKFRNRLHRNISKSEKVVNWKYLGNFYHLWLSGGFPKLLNLLKEQKFAEYSKSESISCSCWRLKGLLKKLNSWEFHRNTFLLIPKQRSYICSR